MIIIYRWFDIGGSPCGNIVRYINDFLRSLNSSFISNMRFEFLYKSIIVIAKAFDESLERLLKFDK